MNLNPLVLAANVQEMSPNKALPKVVSRYNASEFKIVDKLVIGPSPQKGKGLYSLKGIESGRGCHKVRRTFGGLLLPEFIAYVTHLWRHRSKNIGVSWRTFVCLWVVHSTTQQIKLFHTDA